MRLALSAASFYVAPSFSFSGVTFPQFNLFAHWWSLANPLTPFLQLRIEQLQVQAPPEAALGELAVIAGFALFTAALAFWAFKDLVLKPELWGKR